MLLVQRACAYAMFKFNYSLAMVFLSSFFFAVNNDNTIWYVIEIVSSGWPMGYSY